MGLGPFWVIFVSICPALINYDRSSPLNGLRGAALVTFVKTRCGSGEGHRTSRVVQDGQGAGGGVPSSSQPVTAPAVHNSATRPTFSRTIPVRTPQSASRTDEFKSEMSQPRCADPRSYQRRYRVISASLSFIYTLLEYCYRVFVFVGGERRTHGQ